MKSYTLTVNYTQGSMMMTYSMPSIVAANPGDALAVAGDMLKNVFSGVTHVSINSISSFEVAV